MFKKFGQNRLSRFTYISIPYERDTLFYLKLQCIVSLCIFTTAVFWTGGGGGGGGGGGILLREKGTRRACSRVYLYHFKGCSGQHASVFTHQGITRVGRCSSYLSVFFFSEWYPRGGK